jgi:hypothetical protein
MILMDSTVQKVALIAIVLSLLIFIFLLNLYKNRLISYSLKLCSWICEMAINSTSPWVKILVLQLVFFIRILMYLGIVSLEQVDKMTARGFLKHYVLGTRIVLSEYIISFLQSSEKIKKHILSLDASTVNQKNQYSKK